uniref:Uncharacterized protein n=1 Tax=Helianthus annuus TaxID=4232 RepID=A0A251UKV5_HELAN
MPPYYLYKNFTLSFIPQFFQPKFRSQSIDFHISSPFNPTCITAMRQGEQEEPQC